ncbi:terminase large subunit [Saccharopolyspora indica]|uniref:terminase large subunit n=1 Tax=Saccharopolyspora indica TaxID=1229659 RepID=UPI0022EAFED6|nr:terminase large subunit [Saccharopolyspora indica]MDA3643790.1 terminase large subunit [Saccharopolyspora indica]
MSLVELCGPVVFARFDSNGEPVGATRSAAWVQIVAVSQDQTNNTFRIFPQMASPLMQERYGLQINKTIIYAEGGGLIEAITSSPLSMEGKRPTFVLKNETQWWLENNNGHEMANVIQGNVDKAAYGGCRVLSICNAHRPGEESDAEQDWEAFQDVLAGNAVDTGLLYDALEAPADTPVSEIAEASEDPQLYEELLQKLHDGLVTARGDAVWLDIDTLVKSILDVKNDVTESRRKFLNQINAAEDAWITPQEWDRCMSAEIKPLEYGDSITLGFDGSKGNDWTALVACRIDDGALFPIKVWNPEKWDGQIPREQVNATVEHTFAHYDVRAMRADVREFEAYVDQWGVKFGKKLKIKATPRHPVAFDMRGNTKQFTLDCERFEDSVVEGEITHNGDPTLRQHILNAHRRPNNHGISIGKASKDSSRKIDAAVCAVLAYGARQELLMSKKNRGRKVAIFR